MTPVATPIMTQAISWDAALAQTLSSAAERSLTDLAHATVHSVHERVVNVLCDGSLIAIAAESLDDAPDTVRVAPDAWESGRPAPGTPVRASDSALVFAASDGDIVVRVDDAAPWSPIRADLCCVTTGRIRDVAALLAATAAPAAPTAFGAAAASLVAERVERLRVAVLHNEPAAVTRAAQSLVGLGEGLTPTGDDILTGLAFLAAQPGMRLGGYLAAIEAVDSDATTLLAATTLRHALQGRSRQRMHDLAHAVRDDDPGVLRAAVRIREIGHTSGEDILTGIRLALDLESGLRDSRR